MTATNAFVLPTGAYGEPVALDWDEPRPLALIVLDRVGLTPVPITRPDHVELLRWIRNTCREGFSDFRGVIAPAQQARWWAEMRGKVIACLYQDADGRATGYGLLRATEDGRWWSSVAVLPTFGGHGYGGAITRHIVRQSPTGVVWASARNDNPPALRLHCAEDWETIGADNDLTYFRTRPGLCP